MLDKGCGGCYSRCMVESRKRVHLGTIWLHHVLEVGLYRVHSLPTGSATRTIRVKTTTGQSFDLVLLGDSEESLRVTKKEG